MTYTSDYKKRRSEIIDLFTTTFTCSEGAAEGELIGGLVGNMFATVPEPDILVFSAVIDDEIAGTIVFTRLSYPEDDRTVFLLSPVAVSPDQQGKGIGQGLLRHGLNDLQARGVDLVLTYGDINFYSKVGFRQIPEQDARAPLPLRYPEGWLGQSLTDRPFEPIRGPSSCVAALDNPDYW